ncbi:9416_t:CDS:2 [Ambispora gerdemannii]|uniref:9416_t:CDS:1 n=1 Tax=Ambispora gerdemannii TaxID=144530 RepID=A0A9N8VUE0_9GLOM|nr:9416_t:CDS:2 [Ambispora gerdemannii]
MSSESSDKNYFHYPSLTPINIDVNLPFDSDLVKDINANGFIHYRTALSGKLQQNGYNFEAKYVSKLASNKWKLKSESYKNQFKTKSNEIKIVLPKSQPHNKIKFRPLYDPIKPRNQKKTTNKGLNSSNNSSTCQDINNYFDNGLTSQEFPQNTNESFDFSSYKPFDFNLLPPFNSNVFTDFYVNSASFDSQPPPYNSNSASSDSNFFAGGFQLFNRNCSLCSNLTS